jgi:type 1 glutamine amidotransferase
MTPEVEQAMRAFVRQGGGLLAVHSGTAGYESTPVLRALLGGVFVKHPPRCPVTAEPRPGHPLARGAAAFTSTDEHYVMALDDARADVFLTTRSEHGEQPGGWTRGEGEGRVCVLTPGHTVDVWLQPGFQVLLERALLWCAGRPLR